jgi:hypothetical protein
MKTTTNTYVVNSGTESPQAWVAIKRNRQKIYSGRGKTQVYLKDGQEFQVELFNPTQTRYLAKIKINGSYQSDRGLILNPGQRYFLDRFIDEDRKLAFSTYEIEDSKAAKKAIEKNGLLEVEFYAETTFFSTSGTTQWRNPYLYGGTLTVPGTINTFNTTTTGITNPFTYGGSNLSLTSSSTGSMKTPYPTNSSNYSSIVNDASIETGRVEKGEKSDQSFEDGHGTFNSWASYTTTVQVIPLSQKPVETQEIRSYCTGCGSRIKKQTWKFCPNCGTESI